MAEAGNSELETFRAETREFSRLVGQNLLHPSRFAIDPLAADASLPGIAADVAVAAMKNGIGAGNPLPGGYHAHG